MQYTEVHKTFYLYTALISPGIVKSITLGEFHLLLKGGYFIGG